MFVERRSYYWEPEYSWAKGNEDRSDLVENEFGIVYRILIELTPRRWTYGAAMQVQVIKLVKTGQGEHSAYCYLNCWFYDKDISESCSIMMNALSKGEISGTTATDAVDLIFWATVRHTNYLAKFLPKWWEAAKKDKEFPPPSGNPNDWGTPELIQPYDGIYTGTEM